MCSNWWALKLCVYIDHKLFSQNVEQFVEGISPPSSWQACTGNLAMFTLHTAWPSIDFVTKIIVLHWGSCGPGVTTTRRPAQGCNYRRTRTYGLRRLQRQRPPPNVMKTLSFPVHLCLTRVAITPLIWGILSWIFSMLFITAVPTTNQNTRTIFCTYLMIS